MAGRPPRQTAKNDDRQQLWYGVAHLTHRHVHKGWCAKTHKAWSCTVI